MILYLSTIIICMAIIVIFNIVYNIEIYPNNNPLMVILVVVLAVIIEIIIDLILAGILHSVKDKFFENKKFFDVSKKERQFYEKIGIKKWKDKILELGAIGGFSKKKLVKANEIEYLDQFLMENYKGIVVHIANIILGFLIMAIPPYKYAICVGLPVAIVNAFLGLLPIFVLRYNIPKLQVAKKRLQRQKDRVSSQIETNTLDNADTTM